MEFLFGLVFEIFGEVILQVFFQALAEAGLHFLRDPDKTRKQPNAWLLSLGYAAMGALIGLLSLLLFQQSLIHDDMARRFNLLLSPLAGGLGMAAVGAWRRKTGRATIELDRFTYGFVFAFGMTAVRYLGAN
jgi:hypothetical protein